MTKYPIRCKNTIGYFTMNQQIVLDHDGYLMYFGKLIDQNNKVVGGWKCFFKSFPLHPIWWDRNGKKHFAGIFSNPYSGYFKWSSRGIPILNLGVP